MLQISLIIIQFLLTMFRRLKLKRRLKSLGDLVETQYVVFLNNVDPMYFNSRVELYEFLCSFRKENEIFKLQIFRIETYSL